MAMQLKPCGSCPRFTYSSRIHAGRVICDPCFDALTYVQNATTDDLRDLIAANTTDQSTPERTH